MLRSELVLGMFGSRKVGKDEYLTKQGKATRRHNYIPIKTDKREKKDSSRPRLQRTKTRVERERKGSRGFGMEAKLSTRKEAKGGHSEKKKEDKKNVVMGVTKADIGMLQVMRICLCGCGVWRRKWGGKGGLYPICVRGTEPD